MSYDIVVDDYYLINPLAGRLLHASNGNLYGMDRGLIWYRATDFTGSVHEFDLIGGNYNKLMDFGWENGSNPENSTLIQLKSTNGPVARCINTTLYLDENGEAILEPISIDGGSEGEEIELSLSKVNFTCNDIGENTVTLTATDVNGLQSFCNAIVVVADTIAPAIVARDLEIYLDENGNATIEADEVDNGSTDVCGIQSLMLSKKTFTCENLGENIIEFEVTDINGNRSITEVKVFVVDTLSPEITCPQI